MSGGETTCTGNVADIVFVIDSSGSIRDMNPADQSFDNFNLMLAFLNNVVDLLNIGQNGVHVGMVSFSMQAKHEFFLGDYNNAEDIKGKYSGQM